MTNIVHQLCATFAERARSAALRGKKRDAAALEFFLGAAAALLAVGEKGKSNHVLAFAGMVLCVRGYPEIERVLRDAAKVEGSSDGKA